MGSYRMVVLLSGYISGKPQIVYEGTVSMTTTITTVYFPKSFRKIPAVSISPLSTGIIIISTITTSYFVVQAFSVSTIYSTGDHNHYLGYIENIHSHPATIDATGIHTHTIYSNTIAHIHPFLGAERGDYVPKPSISAVSLAYLLDPLYCRSISIITGTPYGTAITSHHHNEFSDYGGEHTHSIYVTTDGAHTHSATVGSAGYHTHTCYSAGSHQHYIGISSGTISFIWSAIEI